MRDGVGEPSLHFFKVAASECNEGGTLVALATRQNNHRWSYSRTFTLIATHAKTPLFV